MRPNDSVALKPRIDPEPPTPQDAGEFVRVGPGSWQHIGAVLERVKGRMLVPGDEGAA